MVGGTVTRYDTREKLKMADFRNVEPYNRAGGYQRSKDVYCLHHQGDEMRMSEKMMEKIWVQERNTNWNERKYIIRTFRICNLQQNIMMIIKAKVMENVKCVACNKGDKYSLNRQKSIVRKPERKM